MTRTEGKRNAKRKSQSKETIEFLSHVVSSNGKAHSEGPHVKRWSIHDMRSIRPLTPAQRDLFESFFQGKQVCAYGSAGTGKSYVGIYLALSEILRENSKQNRIMIVRSAVPTRDVGFMPGTLEEKVSYYEMPYKDIFSDLFGRFLTYDDMKAAGLVEFMTTSFVRGVTWNNTIVILDEIQNCNSQEINSVMTRIGKNTRIIALGDMSQTDLGKKKDDNSGMSWFLKIAERMPDFDLIRFTSQDIVRSNFVKSWIEAIESLEA